MLLNNNIIKMLKLFIIIIFVTICNCWNCNSHIENRSDCSYVPYLQPGTSYQCSCINGCALLINGCYNDTMTNPKTKVWIPATCSEANIMISNTTCDNLYCPLGCLYKNGKCEPSRLGIICHPQNDWSCPNGCTYNRYTNSCTPNDSNDVCHFIENTYTCPYGCVYNYNLGKCISTDPNNICQLQKKLLCPIGCQLNVRGDLCIPKYPIDVQPHIDWVCSTGCTYNRNTNSCEPEGPYDICEMNRGFICPYNLEIDSTNGIKCILKTNIMCNETNTPINTINCIYDDKDKIYKKKICEPMMESTCSYEWPYNIFTDNKYGNYRIEYLLKDRERYADVKCKYTKFGDCYGKRKITQCSQN